MKRAPSFSEKEEEPLWIILSELYNVDGKALAALDELRLLHFITDVNDHYNHQREKVEAWLKTALNTKYKNMGGKTPMELLEEGRLRALHTYFLTRGK